MFCSYPWRQCVPGGKGRWMKSCRSQKALKSYHRLLIGPYCDSSIGNMKKASVLCCMCLTSMQKKSCLKADIGLLRWRCNCRSRRQQGLLMLLNFNTLKRKTWLKNTGMSFQMTNRQTNAVNVQFTSPQTHATLSHHFCLVGTRKCVRRIRLCYCERRSFQWRAVIGHNMKHTPFWLARKIKWNITTNVFNNAQLL